MSKLVNCWAGNFVSVNNEYVKVGSYSTFNFIPTLNAFTIQAWVRTTTGNGEQYIIGKGDAVGLQYAISFADPDLNITIGDDAFSFDINALLGYGLNNDGWHHIVVVVSTTTATLYIAGAQVGAAQALSGVVTRPRDLLIGGIRNVDNTDVKGSWDEYIDEIGIWDEALGAAEITALYNAGVGIALDDDSGNYTSSDHLIGWWRMGDGATENAGGVPTANIADESGNEHSATVESDALDLEVFYAATASAGGPGECPVFDSSSSLYPAIPPRLTITRADQGNLEKRVGFEGDLHRLVVTATGNQDSVPTKLFVYERARVTIGLPLQRPTFRRVATLRDLQTIPEDAPGTTIPFAYRREQAEILCETAAKLDEAWIEIQRQTATLALDLNDFGIPDADGVLRGGRDEAATTDTETFDLVTPSPTPPTPSPSSSSSSPVPIQAPLRLSSSSSLFVSPPQLSSSSLWVDPHALGTRLYPAVATDVVARLTDAATGVKTLFTDLGFVRFGRDSDPLRTWDTFFRVQLDIPKCSLIQTAYLILGAHTSETGEDVVVRLSDIYADAAFAAVGAFSGTDDPAKTNQTLVWSRIAATGAGSGLITPSLADMLQFFVDRGNYTPGSDYFGLWIKEEASDDGARRDATVTVSSTPYLRVEYRDDRECRSSSYLGA